MPKFEKQKKNVNKDIRPFSKQISKYKIKNLQ